MKKLLKRVGIGLIFLLLLLQGIPFFIPVSNAEAQGENPFTNSRFFQTSDQVELHYRTWSAQGEEQGKVLLVHGLGESTFSWRFTAEALAQNGYFVTAVDLPGFGYSSRARGLDHSQKQRSLWVWELLEELNQTGHGIYGNSWHLVGHSMGGGTATAMAMARPEQTASLILADGALFDNNPSSVSTLLRYPPFARWLQVVLEHILITDERIGELLASAYGRSLNEEEQAGYAIPLQLPGTTGSLIDLTRTAKSELIKTKVLADIPVLAIWGEDDTWVPLSATEKIKEVLPQIRVESISGAGHCPMETHAEEFNRILLQYLSK